MPGPHALYVARRINRSRQLHTAGNRRGSLQLLKTEVRKNPKSMELRIALAELYRGMGHSDQAGRWGIAVEGWTTSIERDRLARLLASSGVTAQDIEEFLVLPPGMVAARPDIVALLDGPAARYRERFAARYLERFDRDVSASTDNRGAGFTTAASVGFGLAIGTLLLGILAVFVAAALGFTGSPQIARYVLLASVALAGFASLMLTAAAVAQRRWTRRTASLCLCGLLVTVGTIVGFDAMAGG
ncbi:DUF6584 family protein [Mycetocola zhujimingii]|uniref:DUF6584 family protein n=1 Tax=Mycetocola zhujimingii TaxID=2079792 RepID=UPI000D34A9B3|nr:DUF6584 family protein [Mycetocola zhujimingii]AWB86002.1 hypothetical protein C3E77_04825 [Mycetocola zhujimingii]